MRLQAEVEQRVAVLAVRLGAIQRQVGRTQQRLGSIATGAGHCDADAGGGHDLVAGDLKRLA